MLSRFLRIAWNVFIVAVAVAALVRVQTITVSDHLTVTGTAPSISGASNCTVTSIAAESTDVAGTVTATCTVGQHVDVTFATAWSTNGPKCVVTPTNSGAITDAFDVSSSSTTTVVYTAVVGSAGAAVFNYICIESV